VGGRSNYHQDFKRLVAEKSVEKTCAGGKGIIEKAEKGQSGCLSQKLRQERVCKRRKRKYWEVNWKKLNTLSYG